MQERQQKLQDKYETPGVEQKSRTSSLPFNISLANKKQSNNEKGESINVFKDL